MTAPIPEFIFCSSSASFFSGLKKMEICFYKKRIFLKNVCNKIIKLVSGELILFFYLFLIHSVSLTSCGVSRSTVQRNGSDVKF